MKTIPQNKLNEDLFIVLKTIFHYERIFIEQFGLKFEEIYILQHLRRNPVVRVTDVSRELQLPMFTISRLVYRLTEGGYLSKEQALEDRRNYFLHLSEKGEKTLKDIENSTYNRISANVTGMTETQINELLDLAGQLHVVLGVTKEVVH
ncbi:MAG: winged helix-turn-helix transcriptional regulator [Anaerolineae bacterium]|nr:winged helix-turn-helix transcriptional regulator [Anaerolineae bacterium]